MSQMDTKGRWKQGRMGALEYNNERQDLCPHYLTSSLYSASLYSLCSTSDSTNKVSCMHSAYPQCCCETVLKVCGDAHEQGLAAGDHGHTSSQVPHHMVGSPTHS